MTTAERMRAYRVKNDLTLRGAAERLGVTHTTVKNIERGLPVRVETAQKLAKAWGIKAWHKLLNGGADAA